MFALSKNSIQLYNAKMNIEPLTYKNALLAKCPGCDLQNRRDAVLDYFDDRQRSGGGDLYRTGRHAGFRRTNDESELIVVFQHAEGTFNFLSALQQK